MNKRHMHRAGFGIAAVLILIPMLVVFTGVIIGAILA